MSTTSDTTSKPVTSEPTPKSSRTDAGDREAMFAEVVSTERLSRSMIRVVFAGGGLDRFIDTGFADQYINGQFLPAGAPYAPPFTRDEANADPDQRPRARRYTVRRWEPETGRLTVDFVAHGAEGFAGPWAQRALPGDRLQFRGPGGSYSPDPTAAWYLFVGDESALPAIAVALERLPAGAVCLTRIVVDGPEDELPLDGPANNNLMWLHRRTAASPQSLVVDAVAELTFPVGTPDLFIHGEADEVRAVRRHLVSDRGLDIEGASISPYWRRNFTDEQWREVKASWMAEVRAEG